MSGLFYLHVSELGFMVALIIKTFIYLLQYIYYFLDHCILAKK